MDSDPSAGGVVDEFGLDCLGPGGAGEGWPQEGPAGETAQRSVEMAESSVPKAWMGAGVRKLGGHQRGEKLECGHKDISSTH